MTRHRACRWFACALVFLLAAVFVTEAAAQASEQSVAAATVVEVEVEVDTPPPSSAPASDSSSSLGVGFAPLHTPVPSLTGDQLEALAFQARPLLVEFFAPWCGHCKTLAPKYEEAAVAMSSQSLLAQAQLVKVDCTIERATCQRFGVTGFPTLKLFRRANLTLTSASSSTSDLQEPLVYDFAGTRSTLGLLVFAAQTWEQVTPKPFPALPTSDVGARLAAVRLQPFSLAELPTASAPKEEPVPLDNLGPQIPATQPFTISERGTRSKPAAPAGGPRVIPYNSDFLGLAVRWTIQFFFLVGALICVYYARQALRGVDWNRLRHRFRSRLATTLPTGSSHKIM